MFIFRDCCGQNIMMDPREMYPQGFDFLESSKKKGGRGRAPHYSRTERPPRYYFIDFGLSCRYTDDGPHVEYPVRGGDKTVPEHQGDKYDIPCDPFPTDIYYLGNMIKTRFIQVRCFLLWKVKHYIDIKIDYPAQC